MGREVERGGSVIGNNFLLLSVTADSFTKTNGPDSLTLSSVCLAGVTLCQYFANINIERGCPSHHS